MASIGQYLGQIRRLGYDLQALRQAARNGRLAQGLVDSNLPAAAANPTGQRNLVWCSPDKI